MLEFVCLSDCLWVCVYVCPQPYITVGGGGAHYNFVTWATIVTALYIEIPGYICSIPGEAL